MALIEKYGPAALIAGGSEGVGASYAHLLAEQGFDLFLVARKPEPLEALRAALAESFPQRKVTTLSLDLTEAASIDEIVQATEGSSIGLMIYNAGSCTTNIDFLDNTLDFAQRLVALNATTPMALCHHFGGRMAARRQGGIILVGSLAALVGNPTIAVYSAAKAFSATFAEALWYELKPYGVDVLAHQLGSTDTPFIARHFPQAAGMGDKPGDVARAGLAALTQGPVLRANGGDMFAGMLANMSRGDAVKAAVAAGDLYSGPEV